MVVKPKTPLGSYAGDLNLTMTAFYGVCSTKYPTNSKSKWLDLLKPSFVPTNVTMAVVFKVFSRHKSLQKPRYDICKMAYSRFQIANLNLAQPVVSCFR